MLINNFLLLGAVLWAAIGYVYGGQLTKSLGAEQVICWMLGVSLPLTFTAALSFTPEHPVPTASWMGFAYVSLFSVWIGFFAWYRGLDWGGMVRVSQVIRTLLEPMSWPRPTASSCTDVRRTCELSMMKPQRFRRGTTRRNWRR